MEEEDLVFPSKDKSFHEWSWIGNVAKNLVISIFEESGYRVYPFGYESVFANLKRELHKKALEEDETVERIRSMPDLLIVDADEEKPYFVEVKFRSWESYEIDIDRMEWYKKYWPDSFLVYVTHCYCNFYCQRVSEIKELSLRSFERLDKIFPKVTLDTLVKYKPYAIKLAEISSGKTAMSHQASNYMPFVLKFLIDSENEMYLNDLHQMLCEVVLLSEDELIEAIERYGQRFQIEETDEIDEESFQLILNVRLTQDGIKVAKDVLNNWEKNN